MSGPATSHTNPKRWRSVSNVIMQMRARPKTRRQLPSIRPRFTAHTDMAHGTPVNQVAILEAVQKDHGDLLAIAAIADKALDAMLEAEVSNARLTIGSFPDPARGRDRDPRSSEYRPRVGHEPDVHRCGILSVAVLALLVGGLVYVAFRPSRLLMFSWFDTVGLTPLVGGIRRVGAPVPGVIPGWVIYSLPQALWAFALVLSIEGIWVRRVGIAKSTWIVLAVVLALLPEIGQSVGLVPGTFDPIDFLTLAIAVIVALSLSPEVRMKRHLFSAAVLTVFALLAVGSDDSSTGARSSSSSRTPAVTGAAVATVTAAELLEAYSDNEVRADGLYKGKVITVNGKVESVGKDILDNMYISIAGSNEYSIFSVQAFFDKEYASRLSAYGKGDHVSVTCRCDGKFGNVLLKDCRF